MTNHDIHDRAMSEEDSPGSIDLDDQEIRTNREGAGDFAEVVATLKLTIGQFSNLAEYEIRTSNLDSHLPLPDNQPRIKLCHFHHARF